MTATALLFCHDHRFIYSKNGDVYSPGQFDLTIFARYTSIFDSLIVAARGRDLDELHNPARLSLCSSSKVSFLRLPNLSSPRGLLFEHTDARHRLADAMKTADAVIARLPSEIGLLALAVAKKAGKPAAVEVVACVRDGLRSHGGLVARAYAPVAYLRMRRAVGRADRALYVTEKFLQERYPNHGATTTVSNVELGQPDQNALERRLSRISRNGTIRFGMIAALFHKQKGVDVAIKAFAKAVRHCSNIRLSVLGPGDHTLLKQELEEIGQSNVVEFCGTLPRGEPVLRWLDEIDVYIQASFQEGLPRALIEAMSRGCPALASDAGGTFELMAPECLHKPGDHEELARGICKAATDPDWRQAQAKRNFNRSLDYASKRLNQRRTAFWKEYLAAVKGGR